MCSKNFRVEVGVDGLGGGLGGARVKGACKENGMMRSGWPVREQVPEYQSRERWNFLCTGGR